MVRNAQDRHQHEETVTGNRRTEFEVKTQISKIKAQPRRPADARFPKSASLTLKLKGPGPACCNAMAAVTNVAKTDLTYLTFKSAVI